MFLDQVFLPLFSNTTVTHYRTCGHTGHCFIMSWKISPRDFNTRVHSLPVLEILGLIERRPLCGVYETRTRQAVNCGMKFTRANRWDSRGKCGSLTSLVSIRKAGTHYPPSLAYCNSTVFKLSPDNFFHFKVGRRLFVIFPPHCPYCKILVLTVIY